MVPTSHRPTGTEPWERPAPADRAARSEADRAAHQDRVRPDRRCGPSPAARRNAAQHARHDDRRRRLRRAARHVRPDRRHRRDVAARLERAGLAVPRVGPGRRRSRPADPGRHPPPERPDPARPVRERVPVRRPAQRVGRRPDRDAPGGPRAQVGAGLAARVLPPVGRDTRRPAARSGRSTPSGGARWSSRSGPCATEQRLDGGSPYRFHRPDGDPTDDVPNDGLRAPSPPERDGPRRVPPIGRCVGAAAERARQPGPRRRAGCGRARRGGRGCAGVLGRGGRARLGDPRRRRARRARAARRPRRSGRTRWTASGAAS